MDDDRQLLCRYAADGSEPAFGELVARHVNLVYSAALRRTSGDAHLAQDIAQLVFTDLARKARSLPENVVLAGWLHRATRYAAAQLLRTERRRAAREQEAVTMNSILSEADSDPAHRSPTDADWAQIRLLLDQALDDLSDEDRDAVILRFFEQRSLTEVGNVLGANEDAARKRVTRALEKLRAHLVRRGITTTAATLSAAISVNAVHSAPIGLAAALSTTAVAGTTLTAAAATATQTIAMTTLQKTIIGATLAAAVGVGIYEARQASNARAEVDMLRQQQAPQNEQIQQLTREREEVANRLAALREENERLNRNASELLRLRGEVAMLRLQTRDLRSTDDKLRSMSIPLQAPTNQKEFEEMCSQMAGALKRIGLGLRQFMTNNPNGVIIDQAGQLNKGVFSGSSDLPLDRFQILVQDAQQLALAMEQQPKLIIAKSAAAIPFNRHWTRLYLLADGALTTTTIGSEEEAARGGFLLQDKEMLAFAEANDPVRRILRPAIEAFAAANNGRQPTDPFQLQPYITTPEQQAVLQEESDSRKAAAAPARP